MNSFYPIQIIDQLQTKKATSIINISKYWRVSSYIEFSILIIYTAINIFALYQMIRGGYKVNLASKAKQTNDKWRLEIASAVVISNFFIWAVLIYIWVDSVKMRYSH
jgi:hypothetical protein